MRVEPFRSLGFVLLSCFDRQNEGLSGREYRVLGSSLRAIMVMIPRLDLLCDSVSI